MLARLDDVATLDELDTTVELDVLELIDVELGETFVLPPPSLPPQAVNPRVIRVKVRVLVRDCMVYSSIVIKLL